MNIYVAIITPRKPDAFDDGLSLEVNLFVESKRRAAAIVQRYFADDFHITSITREVEAAKPWQRRYFESVP